MLKYLFKKLHLRERVKIVLASRLNAGEVELRYSFRRQRSRFRSDVIRHTGCCKSSLSEFETKMINYTYRRNTLTSLHKNFQFDEFIITPDSLN